MWLDNGKIGYKIGQDIFTIGAYADDMTIITGDAKAMDIQMKKVTTFMDFHGIKINCYKSTYHWDNEANTGITVQGGRLREEGPNGNFTYLGWTTNLQMDWESQVHTCLLYTSPSPRD